MTNSLWICHPRFKNLFCKNLFVVITIIPHKWMLTTLERDVILTIALCARPINISFKLQISSLPLPLISNHFFVWCRTRIFFQQNQFLIRNWAFNIYLRTNNYVRLFYPELFFNYIAFQKQQFMNYKSLIRCFDFPISWDFIIGMNNVRRWTRFSMSPKYCSILSCLIFV